MPELTTDKGGETRILAQGTGSIVNLPALTSLVSDQGGNYSTLQATQGGQVKSPNLTSLSDVLLTIDGTGTQDTAQITSIVGGTLTVTGGSPSVGDLTTFNNSTLNFSGGSLNLSTVTSANGASFVVSGGVSLTLPGLTEYTGGVNYSTTLEASGIGSTLDLPNVTTWEGEVGCCWGTQISALSGGQVSLPELTTDKGGETRILRREQAASSTCRH